MNRVLIIEDTAAIREDVAEILRYNGYEVFMASDGSDGIDAAREHLPDIIICDIMMPEIQGYDVLRELRRDSKTASIPFIFLTAVSDIRLGMELGADDYLIKPFKDRDLLAALKTRLEKRADIETLQLRRLTRKFLQVQEENRRTWARTLQDHISQPLVGLKLSLQNTDHLTPQQLQARLEDVHQVTDQVLAQAMASINTIWPVILDELGLLPALLHQFDQLFLDTGLRVQFTHSGLNTSFPQDIKMTVYRVVQEVVSNAVRHAQVLEVVVAVWTENDVLHIDIEDHGIGFDIDLVMGEGEVGGLAEVNDRLLALGGEITIRTALGAGVRVTAHVPLQAEITDPMISHETLNARKTQSAAMRTEQDAVAEPEIRILIAVDNQIVREGLKRLLETETRIQVVGEAVDRSQILTAIQDARPDVLILGIAMNGTSNLDLIQPTISLQPDVRVLVFTNQSNDLYLYESLRAGASGCILNTIEAHELITAVHRVAQGENYWSAPLTEETIQRRFDAYQTVSPETARLNALTPREQEILRMIAQGSTSKKIAAALSISPRTAETHRTNIASKLGLHTQADLIRFALKHGLST